jgi:hypothetical protein
MESLTSPSTLVHEARFFASGLMKIVYYQLSTPLNTSYFSRDVFRPPKI